MQAFVGMDTPTQDEETRSIQSQIKILEARNAPADQINALRQRLAAMPTPERVYSVAEITWAQRQKMQAEYERQYGDGGVAAALAAEQRQRGEVLNHLRHQVDPGLGSAVASAAQAVDEAQHSLTAARQRLAQHKATPPAMAGNVTAWAKAKGQLEDELSGYESLLQQRQAEHRQASAAYHQALDAAWRREYQQAITALDKVTAENRQRIDQAQAALDAAHQSAQAAANQASQRISILQRYRPGQE